MYKCSRHHLLTLRDAKGIGSKSYHTQTMYVYNVVAIICAGIAVQRSVYWPTEIFWMSSRIEPRCVVSCLLSSYVGISVKFCTAETGTHTRIIQHRQLAIFGSTKTQEKKEFSPKYVSSACNRHSFPAYRFTYARDLIQDFHASLWKYFTRAIALYFQCAVLDRFVAGMLMVGARIFVQ